MEYIRVGSYNVTTLYHVAKGIILPDFLSKIHDPRKLTLYNTTLRIYIFEELSFVQIIK